VQRPGRGGRLAELKNRVEGLKLRFQVRIKGAKILETFRASLATLTKPAGENLPCVAQFLRSVIEIRHGVSRLARLRQSFKRTLRSVRAAGFEALSLPWNTGGVHFISMRRILFMHAQQRRRALDELG
jgi:hypothetical protein